MIIDIDLQVIRATGHDSIIMKEYGQTCWIRFFDLLSAVDTISDFRTEKELADFQPKLTLSRFIRMNQMGRIKAIRSNRKNLLRHSLPWYQDQWESISNVYCDNSHKDGYSIDYSNEFLSKYGRMKLVAVKMV